MATIIGGLQYGNYGYATKILTNANHPYTIPNAGPNFLGNTLIASHSGKCVLTATINGNNTYNDFISNETFYINRLGNVRTFQRDGSANTGTPPYINYTPQAVSYPSYAINRQLTSEISGSNV